MSFAARWSPRRRLSAAIGWSVFAIVALAALLAAQLAATEAERHARADAQALLAELAAQSQQMLAADLATRRLLLQSTAAQIAASNDRGAAALRRHLEAVRSQFPEFAWLGVAGAEGRIVAGTAGVLEGDSAADLAWFAQARSPSRLVLMATPAALAATAGARSIAIGAPLVAAYGRSLGVVGGVLAWDWLLRLQAGMLQALGAQRGLELLLVAPDGEVLAGPAGWVGRRLAADDDASEAGRYLVGAVAAGDAAQPAWRELVRQPAAAALAPARAVQRAVFGVVLLAGLVAAFVAMWVTQRMMRELRRLARQAAAVQSGAQRSIDPPGGDDEVSRIGATLAALVDALQREKDALTALNAELDARVAERSARIEQLALESRDAAVTRERLRLARELHDTLAHSLMALLTQIRLVRKLRPRVDAAGLDAELAHAEAAAAEGLVEARAAIARIRASPVRDAGLGAALQALASRFAARSGVAVAFDADADIDASLADDRAETLYRIADEALRNVERHAAARHVTLRLRREPALSGEGASPGRMLLEIADDGIGFDPELPRPGHFGLQGMREQAALIGASLAVHSDKGSGTRIELAIDAPAMPPA